MCAYSISELGKQYHEQGKIEEALEIYEKRFEMEQAIYGDECAHPHVAITLDNLGQVYHDQGKLEEALEIYKRSIKMKRAFYGEEQAFETLK